MSTRAEAWIQQGIEKGRAEGAIRTAREAVMEALRIRFGDVPEQVRRELERIEDRERLRRLHEVAIVTGSLAEFVDAVTRRRD